VVAVASKNTKRGEMPDTRLIFALRFREPLVAWQVEPSGPGVAMTVTLAVVVAVPVGPVHLITKTLLVAGVRLCVPLVAKLPLHPPDAKHEVAPVELQVKLTEDPRLTVAESKVRVTAGVLRLAAELPLREELTL